MSAATNEFINLMKHPVKFRMFLFTKLPAAFFSGLRLQALTETTCTVSVPYKRFTQNPFKSTYFACLAMAAEMSTGALSLMHVHKRQPSVSMLVVKLEAAYFKKATGISSFTCNDGDGLKTAIERAVANGEGQTFTTTSVGLNAQNEKIAEFMITWSFKTKRLT